MPILASCEPEHQLRKPSSFVILKTPCTNYVFSCVGCRVSIHVPKITLSIGLDVLQLNSMHMRSYGSVPGSLSTVVMVHASCIGPSARKKRGPQDDRSTGRYFRLRRFLLQRNLHVQVVGYEGPGVCRLVD